MACGIFFAVAAPLTIWHNSRFSQVLFLSTKEDTQKLPQEEKRRKIYPHSVIPGGVMNSEELAAALATDSTAARHYSDFHADHAVLTYARFEHQSAFASYRSRNKIFWTKKRINIAPTEIVLTDGKSFARTRCGNRLSGTPQEPTSQEEPTEEALSYLPPPISNTLLRMPASLEAPPSIQLSKVYELSFETPLANRNNIVMVPLRLTSGLAGGVTSVPTRTGVTPEPASILLIISGWIIISIAVYRKERRFNL